MPWINCEIQLDFSCSKNCMISETLNTAEIYANPVAAPPIEHALATSTTSALFQINYVLVVILSINNNITFLENMKQGFKKNSFLE